MSLKYKFSIILLSVCAVCLFGACIFAGCSAKEEPYYGTYYGGRPDDADTASISIAKDGITVNGNRNKIYKYTYTDGVITLESGLKINIAENSRVAYLPAITNNFQGEINTRNGYFSANLLDISDYTVRNSYRFNSDGTFTFTDTKKPSIKTGYYNLKDGVLSLNHKSESGASGVLDRKSVV